MKKSRFERLKNLNLKQWVPKRNNRIRLLFLGLSLLLWLFIKLSKGAYVSTIDFPIDYSELPEGLVLNEEPPQSLTLKLQGTGYTLIKYDWFNFIDLDIDLETLETNSKGQSYWTSKNAISHLEAQLSNDDTRILTVAPDTIFLKISRLSEKEVPIIVNTKLGFDTTAYILYGKTQVFPKTVLVTAPAEILEGIEAIYTLELELEEPLDSIRKSLKLEIPDHPNISLSISEVEALINISALTEGKAELEVLTINVPDSLNMELFPSTVEVTYRCALRDFKDIRADEFLIYADYNEIIDNPSTRFLSLNSENPPSQINGLTLRPKRVEYILSKR